MSTKTTKPPFSAYRCHYCKYKASSFQSVVGHCVGSHAEREIAVCQPVLDHSTGRLLTKRQRFGITPKQHLRVGQKIVCSLDRLALGVIDVDSNVGVHSAYVPPGSDQIPGEHEKRDDTQTGADVNQKVGRRKTGQAGNSKKDIMLNNSHEDVATDDRSSERGSDNEAEEKASLQVGPFYYSST